MDESNGFNQALAAQGVSPEWAEYAPLFGAALISILIPLFLFVVARLVVRSSGGPVHADTKSDWSAARERAVPTLGRRFNSRVFVPVAMAMLLIGLGALMIPLAAALGPIGQHETNVPAGHTAVLLCFIGAQALVALLYGAGKGDIKKLTTHAGEPTVTVRDEAMSKGEVK